MFKPTENLNFMNSSVIFFPSLVLSPRLMPASNNKIGHKIKEASYNLQNQKPNWPQNIPNHCVFLRMRQKQRVEHMCAIWINTCVVSEPCGCHLFPIVFPASKQPA